jgi:hypothetical protein
MLPAISLLVYALAVARVTRLVTSDRITEAPRRRLSIWLWAKAVPDPDVQMIQFANAYWAKQPAEVVKRHIAMERFDDGADPPLLVYLIGCPWCVSIYVGAVAAPLVYFLGASPWLLVPALALAFSYVTGYLAQKGE